MIAFLIGLPITEPILVALSVTLSVFLTESHKNA
jgi:hypothetical protein